MITRAIILYLTFGFISVLANNAAAGLKPENFNYTAELHGDTVKGGLYRAHLTDDILQHCRCNCGDIRLFDADNNEVPYIILQTRNDHKRESHEVEFLDFKEGSSGAVLTMRIPDNSDQVNNIKIDTPNKDFRVGVMIYGSNDRSHWTSVASDVIYDFTSQVDIRKTDIRIPVLRFKYLKLKMTYGAGKGAGDQVNLKYNGLDFSASMSQVNNIRINKIHGEVVVEGDTKPTYDKIPFSRYSTEKGKKNETMIVINTGIPLQRIYLDVANPYYFRRVSVYWDEKGKTYSQEVGRGTIYRFPVERVQEVKDYIDLTSYRKGFYKVVIENDSNPLLDIKGLRLGWIQRQLFFVALRDSKKYKLSVGSDAVDAQTYDLSRLVNDQNWNKLNVQPISLSSTFQTAGYRPVTRDDQKTAVEKMILISIIVLLLAGMGFWLYTLLRKTTGEKSQD